MDGARDDTVGEVAAWRGCRTGQFELKVLPGGHPYLETCVGDVARIIAAAVAQKTTVASQERPPARQRHKR